MCRFTREGKNLMHACGARQLDVLYIYMKLPILHITIYMSVNVVAQVARKL